MTADNIIRGYGDTNIKEDVVLNAIQYITPVENWFVKNLGKSKAIALTHIFQEDTYRSRTTQSVEAGNDYTALALTTPTRLANVIEHVALPFKVNYSEQFVEHYTGTNELERQTTKALSEWGEAAEFDIVRSTLVSGASGTTPKMAGILQAISKSTNFTLQTSGTTFSASILNGLMKAQWDNSSVLATDLFVGSGMRVKIDYFTQKSNAVIASVGMTEIVNSVDVYRTSHGNVRLHNHRDVFVSGTDANDRVLGVNPDTMKIAYLKMPYIRKDLASSGPYDFRAVAGDLTLEVRYRDANFFANGYLI